MPAFFPDMSYFPGVERRTGNAREARIIMSIFRVRTCFRAREEPFHFKKISCREMIGVSWPLSLMSGRNKQDVIL